MENVINLDDVRKQAEDYYANGDYYCSEAVVRVMRDTFNLSVSDECIKMASGFPVGVGGARCMCGAVSGGVLALGLAFGRSEAKDPAVNTAMELSRKLLEKFTEAHKVTCCRVLVKGMKLGSAEHMKQCVALTGEMAYECGKIIAQKKGLKFTTEIPQKSAWNLLAKLKK